MCVCVCVCVCGVCMVCVCMNPETPPKANPNGKQNYEIRIENLAEFRFFGPNGKRNQKSDFHKILIFDQKIRIFDQKNQIFDRNSDFWVKNQSKNHNQN